MIHNKHYQILKYFLRGYNKQIHGRELINKVEISQKNIALTLNELEKKNILSSKRKGNMKYFFFNKSNPLIRKYLVLAELMHSIGFLQKSPKISHILDKIKKSNQIICVFGSYAKDKQKKDSDLDLFIVGSVDKKQIKKISETYNLKISIKNASKLNFIKSLKEGNSLMNEILEDHIILSGYEEFVEEVVKQKW